MAAVATTAAIVAVGLVLRPGSEAPATAAELLRQTAAIAAEQQPPADEGPYLYAKIQTDQLLTSSEGGQPWSVVIPTTEETWIGADGSGRIVSAFGEPRFLGSRDRERWAAAGSPELPSGDSDTTFPPEALPYEDLSALPTDPEDLLSVLQDQVADEDLSQDVAVLTRIGELLASGDATPELRSALYRVASRLPGVELVGEVSDPLGREGVGVAVNFDNQGATMRALMIFDEDTSRLLAQEQLLLESASWIDAESGSRITYIAYLEAGRTPTVTTAP